MKKEEFINWLAGFVDGCDTSRPSAKQWDRIKEVLNEVEDYDDYAGLDEEIDDWVLERQKFKASLTGSLSSISSATTSGSLVFSNTHTSMVWNDKMGCWHYTNYPDGFGYYISSTLDRSVPEETKKQLLD